MRLFLQLICIDVKISKQRQWMVGRLAGAAAFERVTKAYEGKLIAVGNGK